MCAGIVHINKLERILKEIPGDYGLSP